MGAKVLYRDSQGRDGSVDLRPDTPCYVGRALDCAIRTDDAMVSRKHSMIRMENGAFYVEDLGSSNGTIVNNQRVSKQKLNHNDVVRCGSLWLRYVEDGPLMPASAGAAVPGPPAGPSAGYGSPAGGYGGAPGGYGAPQTPAGGYGGAPGGYAAGAGYGSPPAMPAAVTPQPKRGGTQRLDVGSAAAAAPIPSSNPGSSGYGGTSPSSFGGYSSPAAGPFGSPPPMPGDTPFGSPPPMPSEVASPFGSPPPMPSEVASPFGSPPPMPSAAGPAPGTSNPFARPDAEQSVLVDMGDENAEKALKELAEARARLDELQASYDREVADGKRMRAETATLKDRIEELRAAIKDREEQVKAHVRVSDELRDELNRTKADLAGARHELAALGDAMQAKERQLSKTQDDIGKLKDEIEDMARQLAEVSKTKDDGWKKLNNQLTEIEHLREVINEQERMLEERRVGLISQEEVIKELRADKERQIKTFAQLKAERDELLTNDSRRAAQLQAIEEENKRLSRLLIEIQKGGGWNQEHTTSLTDELKTARIEARKMESDRDRYQEMYERAEAQVQRLEDRLAQLEVELREANDQRATATSSQSVIEDSLAKAEVARAKAAEEALDAVKARDEARAAAESARREADRLRRKLETLEKAGQAAGGEDAGEIKAENDALKRKLRLAQDQANELERTVSSMKAELDAAQADAKAARAMADAAQARAAQQGDAGGAAATGAGGEDAAAAIRDKAAEVYESINGVLSDIRNNVKLVQDEFAAFAGDNAEESVRIIADTIQMLIDSAEDAKGVIRGLRELVEFN